MNLASQNKRISGLLVVLLVWIGSNGQPGCVRNLRLILTARFNEQHDD